MVNSKQAAISPIGMNTSIYCLRDPDDGPHRLNAVLQNIYGIRVYIFQLLRITSLTWDIAVLYLCRGTWE